MKIIFLLLLPGSFAWAENPKYPDGLAGQVPVIQRVSQSSPYTVPAGKNLYITNVAGSSQKCGMFELSCHLTATGATNLLDASYVLQINPILVGPGTVVASTSSAITFDINGFLVPAQVAAVLTDLAPSSAYFVPNGNNFYLLRLGALNTAMSSPRLTVGGVQVSIAASEPTLIPGGQSIVNSGNALVTLIGYLKPQ